MKTMQTRFFIVPVLLLASCATRQQEPGVGPEDSRPLYQILPDTDVQTLPDNCLVGCPAGGGTQVLYRNAYTLENNPATKFASWIAYKITTESQATGRTRSWKKDPDLPDNDTLEPAAYKNANAILAVDRGHQAPLASLGGVSDWVSLNYLSNITPQKSTLNQGPWAALEAKERQLTRQADVTAVYSLTGPLFERDLGSLPAMPAIRIPSGYWKILFINSGPEKGDYAAFILDQDSAKTADFCRYQVTVAEIEKRTQPRLIVWPALSDETAKKLKATEGILAKERMGCL